MARWGGGAQGRGGIVRGGLARRRWRVGAGEAGWRCGGAGWRLGAVLMPRQVVRRGVLEIVSD